MEETSHQDFDFYCETVYGNAFKIFNSLTPILTDVNLLFTKEGIGMKKSNNAKTVLIDFILHAKDFSTFYVNPTKGKVILGVKIQTLVTYLKAIEDNSIVKIYKKMNDDQFCIELDKTANKSSKTTLMQIRILDVTEDEIQLKELDYETSASMNAKEFNNTIKNMASISKILNLTLTDKSIIFETRDIEMSSGSRMTMFSHKSDDSELDSESENDNDDDHGCLIDSSNFKVEHLLMIGKCTTNITSNITISLKEDLPLLVKFPLSSLGEISFIVARYNGDE